MARKNAVYTGEELRGFAKNSAAEFERLLPLADRLQALGDDAQISVAHVATVMAGLKALQKLALEVEMKIAIEELKRANSDGE